MKKIVLGEGYLDSGNGAYHIQLLDWRGRCTVLKTKRAEGKKVRLIVEVIAP